MSTSKVFRDFVLEQMKDLQGITCRPMMGEYLLYYNEILFGGIYDDRVLVKKTSTNQEFQLEEQIPYASAKPMFYIQDLDHPQFLKEIILKTVKGIPLKKK
ncbi:MAG: TfoX/Sxy family protein [Roseburia sp.]|nr:TfoX/Sxy family protein [Anaeroplasma bactoclasticum]MCM1195650.1 TfoX/Sxy family protein [Roseburia sp.]MCM1556606.1 TfoX/Sxy family protein [Anaeroplasma bactoclasticum]